MGELALYVLVGVLLLLAFLRLALRESNAGPRHDPPLNIRDFRPIHHHEFEEVEHRLAEYDAMLQRIHCERREVALSYLNALRDDFVRVQQLLTHAAKFLPEVTLEGEGERLWVGLRFRFECGLARLWIKAGIVPAGQLRLLTRQVRMLALCADQALAEIAREHGLRVLQADLNR